MTEEYHRSMVFSIHRFIMRLPFIVSLYGKPQFDLSYLYASTTPTINSLAAELVLVLSVQNYFTYEHTKPPILLLHY